MQSDESQVHWTAPENNHSHNHNQHDANDQGNKVEDFSLKGRQASLWRTGQLRNLQTQLADERVRG